MRFPACAPLLACAVAAGLVFAGTVEARAADADLAAFDRAVARCATERPVQVGAHERQVVRCAPRRAPRDPWRFAVTLYGWLASTDGTIWSEGQSSDFSLSFEEALENTKGGIQGAFAVEKGKWRFGVNVTYANLGQEKVGSLGILKLEADVEQLMLDARIGYRVGRWNLGPADRRVTCKPCRTLDLFVEVGARYYRTDIVFDVELGRLLSRRFTETSESTDALVGLRATVDLPARFLLAVRADYGGLFTGGEDDYSWETAAYLGYALSRNWIVYLGYRVQGQVRLTGAGPTKSGSDLILHGPQLGIGLAF